METDVKEKYRSLFRFLGLAAFILGPLWYLFKMTTRGLWISGMMGLTLALVGYITLRLVDEEKGWKGSVLRAAKWGLGKIRTWPLWVQYGLLSLVLAATMDYVGRIAVWKFDNIDFFAATFAPVWILSILPIDIIIPSIFLRGLLFFGLPVGFWFLVGSLLGKATELFSGRFWLFIIAWSAIYATLIVAARFAPYIEY